MASVVVRVFVIIWRFVVEWVLVVIGICFEYVILYSCLCLYVSMMYVCVCVLTHCLDTREVLSCHVFPVSRAPPERCCCCCDALSTCRRDRRPEEGRVVPTATRGMFGGTSRVRLEGPAT